MAPNKAGTGLWLTAEDEVSKEPTRFPGGKSKARQPKERSLSGLRDRSRLAGIENPFETFTEWSLPPDRAYDGEWPSPRLDAIMAPQQI